MSLFLSVTTTTTTTTTTTIIIIQTFVRYAVSAIRPNQWRSRAPDC